MAESVYVTLTVQNREGADEDDIGVSQFIVIHARHEQVSVYEGLIIASTAEKAFAVRLAYLHLNAVYGIFIVLNIDVEPDALALVGGVDGLLFFKILYVMDFDFEDFLKHALADAFPAHDEFEHIVILDSKLFPGLDGIRHGVISPLL